jgi:hypothetical protein
MKRILIPVAAVAVVAFSLLCALPPPAAAQAGDNAELPLPPPAPPPGNGIPDFNGVWQMPYTPDLSRPLGAPPPFTPFGADAFKNHTGADDPTGFCQPTGPTRAFHSPFPFQIVQTGGQITFLHEIHHTFRRAFTDGRGHTPDYDITWWGDSVGKYEGNKLTLDTVGISERSWLDTAGHQHSDKLHLTEVFEKTGPDTFNWTVTYDDPAYYTKPWSVTLTAKRQKYDIMEMICTDNNRDIPHFISSPPKK